MNTEIGKMKKEDLLKIIGKMKKNDLVNIIINKIGGNKLIQISIDQIIISPAIKKVILEEKQNFNNSKFNLSNTGFGLSRMNNIKKLSYTNFQDLITRDPPKVKFHHNNNGIDYYKIMDGRHRIARSIIDGMHEINVILIE
jgi:predicted ATPase